MIHGLWSSNAGHGAAFQLNEAIGKALSLAWHSRTWIPTELQKADLVAERGHVPCAEWGSARGRLPFCPRAGCDRDRAPTQSFLGCEAGIQMVCSATSSVSVAMPRKTDQQKVLEAVCKIKVSFHTLKFQSPQKI